jgi:hypothetical protein
MGRLFVAANVRLTHRVCMAVFCVLPIVTLAEVQDGRYSGTLNCGPALTGAPQAGWSVPLNVEISKGSISWWRRDRNYSETGRFAFSAQETVTVDAAGAFFSGSGKKGFWRSVGTMRLQDKSLVGSVKIMNTERTVIFRDCTLNIPVVLADRLPSTERNFPDSQSQARNRESQKLANIAPPRRNEDAVKAREPGNRLSETPLMRAAMLPDEQEAIESVLQVARSQGLLRLPPINPRTHYQCASQIDEWASSAAKQLVASHIESSVSGNRRAEISNWMRGIRGACNPQVYDALDNQLRALDRALAPIRNARAQRTEQVAIEQRRRTEERERLREEEKQAKIAATAAREQQEATARAQRIKQETRRRAAEEAARSQRNKALAPPPGSLLANLQRSWDCDDLRWAFFADSTFLTRVPPNGPGGPSFLFAGEYRVVDNSITTVERLGRTLPGAEIIPPETLGWHESVKHADVLSSNYKFRVSIITDTSPSKLRWKAKSITNWNQTSSKDWSADPKWSKTPPQECHPSGIGETLMMQRWREGVPTLPLSPPELEGSR